MKNDSHTYFRVPIFHHHLVIIRTTLHNVGLYNRCWDYYYLMFVFYLLNKTHSATKSRCKMKTNNFIIQDDMGSSVILAQFRSVNIYSMIFLLQVIYIFVIRLYNRMKYLTFYAEWSHLSSKSYSLFTKQPGNHCRLGIKRVKHIISDWTMTVESEWACGILIYEIMRKIRKYSFQLILTLILGSSNCY
jgi:hypothetical protein